MLSAGVANKRRDRTDKLVVYGRQGVQEYWIVDRKTRTFEIYRNTGDSFTQNATIGEQQALESPLLPEFTLLLERVFRGVLQE